MHEHMKFQQIGYCYCKVLNKMTQDRDQFKKIEIELRLLIRCNGTMLKERHPRFDVVTGLKSHGKVGPPIKLRLSHNAVIHNEPPVAGGLVIPCCMVPPRKAIHSVFRNNYVLGVNNAWKKSSSHCSWHTSKTSRKTREKCSKQRPLPSYC